MESRVLLRAENLSYNLTADRTLFQEIDVSIQAGDRIALVGPNGVGKSTLLQLLAGLVQPSSGSIYQKDSIYYLPQISTLPLEQQQQTVLAWLNSIADDWWAIADILETKLATVVDLSLSIANLSGGELTKLFLAIGLAQEPRILLLDEPTNHMDLAALEALRQFLCHFSGAFVIVSHKPFFLDQVANTTWELMPTGIQVYGGNFSFYKEQKAIALENAERSHEAAKKDLKRAKEAALKEQQRAARSQREGRLQALDNSMGKAAKRYFANRASATAGTAAKKHDIALVQAQQKLAETKIRTSKATLIRLEEKLRKVRNLIDIQGADLRVGDRTLIKDIQLHVKTGDRIAVLGANGSGKSTLVKAILGLAATEAVLEAGEVRLATDLQAMYLDQTYAVVDRQKTILENMQAANPQLSYQLLRQQLGHFLFFNETVYQSAAVLSGGELARLAIAMITISEVDLLILDEPTNNLDTVTVEPMIAALNQYQGALWVISHDLDFLSQIGITKALRLNKQTLQPTTHLPSDSPNFYRELLA
ncbi:MULTISPECIES: ribosomal protection-like ABC-F family protein [Trichocoleus]|uniref:ATP-binding cassette domain-containing protein n=1 Tax=Trichocoleus desertorum GB2-A4 TaxID=2933944 RepID=A0ABV0J522_9CYAN|nr:ABC-F family ATP-binding cassette domain-containing protein [Trichocoleus sp. FACHB-46]MBD1863713.1 ABC-F family ATP-binding cassette domain-containing protein [Trichocoleus sp. FACHB-46]